MVVLKIYMQKSQEQVDVLRQENAILKEEGAVGGTAIGGQQPTCTVPPRFAVRTQELSREMMQAATTAETNLRLVSVRISLVTFANATATAKILSDFYLTTLII